MTPLIRVCRSLVLVPALLCGQATTQAVAPRVPKPGQYRYITPAERAIWFVHSVIGPSSIMGGVVSAAWGTEFDTPREYGPTWEGFGKRYGMRLTGVSVGNAMEATLGALWGEDPRYFRARGRPFKARVGNILKFTLDDYRSDGSVGFGYARLAGNVGNNFLSNTWRAPSEADWQHALLRIVEGVGSKAAANAFAEFWPDLNTLGHYHHRKRQAGNP
ncbi:MAG TPA: hypothetical protein VLJ11_10270 [Bryobacteraceae bacterium]|nr:hypothetical protein [Bryobacteraceae bacterium]